jgi:cystathionine beta-lyase
MIEPEGTYLLWIDFRSWKVEQECLMKLFMKYGVRLNSGSNYGECGNGFVRMNIATQRNILEKALNLMKKARQEVIQ